MRSWESAPSPKTQIQAESLYDPDSGWKSVSFWFRLNVCMTQIQAESCKNQIQAESMYDPDSGWKFVFVLRFYGQVNPLGSCQAQSVYLPTLFLGRLSPLSS